MRAGVIRHWTGREARALREAKHQTVREFACYLGVSARTVSKWEAAREGISPRPEMQAALDTALAQASADERMRLLARLGPVVFGAGIALEVRLPLGLGTRIAAESDPAAVVIQAGHWQVVLTASPEGSVDGALDSVESLIDGLVAMRDKLAAAAGNRALVTEVRPPAGAPA